MGRAADLDIVLEGSLRCIRLSPKAAEEYAKICAGRDDRARERKRSLERAFERFCNHQLHGLSEEKLKRLGSFAAGGHRQVVLWEFKAFAWRLYGAVLHVNGKQCFVGVKVDPDKKQDRANQETLKLTASIIGGLSEFRDAIDKSGVRNEKSKRRR